MDPQPMEPEIDDPTESEIKLLATIADLREKLAAQQAIIDKLIQAGDGLARLLPSHGPHSPAKHLWSEAARDAAEQEANDD